MVEHPFSVTDLLWAAIAMIGGIAKYLDGFLRGKDKPALCKMVANAFVSGFSGYMVAKAVYHVQPEWVTVAAGVGGYMGTQAIDVLTSVMKAILFKHHHTSGEDDNNKP